MKWWTKLCNNGPSHSEHSKLQCRCRKIQCIAYVCVYVCIHITTFDYCYCMILKWLLIMKWHPKYSYIFDTFIHCLRWTMVERKRDEANTHIIQTHTHTHMHAFNIKRANNNNKKQYTIPHNSIWCTIALNPTIDRKLILFTMQRAERKKNE